MLEVKRGDRPRSQTEIVEFKALPFRSKVNVKFGHFTP